MIKTRLPLVVNLFLSVLFVGIVASCSDDDGPESPSVTITSIAPTTTRAGETVTINGTGFSTDRPSNIVLFKGSATSAAVTSATATELKVTVPTNVVNGPISVTVAGQTATSLQEFVLDTSLGAPKITSINPTNGFVGTEITITGENFSTTKSDLSVLFNTTSAEIKSSTLTQVVAVVPEGLTEGDVSVTVKRGDMTSVASTFVVNKLPVSVKVTYWSSQTGNTINRGEISDTGVKITTLYDENSGCKGPAGLAIDVEHGFVYWINQYEAEIVKGNLDGSGTPEILFNGSDGLVAPSDIAYDIETNQLYFADIGADGMHQYIRKGDVSGTVLGTVYELAETNGYPFGVKIIITDGKVYWTDIGAVKVYQGSLDGDVNKIKLLFDSGDGLTVPAGLAVDPLNGKIFIVDNPSPGGTATDAIYMGNLNGEGTLTSIVEAGDDVKEAVDVEIDLENNYIFWINSVQDGDIKRAKTDGSSVETLFGGIYSGFFFDLDIR